jgi:phosphodiesterase/alkaline phosphatase D-like protein
LRKVLSHFLKLSVLLLTFLVFSSCGDIPDEALNNEGSSVLVNGTGRAATASVNSSQPPAVLPPVVTEEAVVKAGGAVLLGMVNPKTEETDVWFEWGNDPVLAEVRRSARQLVHTDIQTISYELSGLQRGANYYFRIVASNPSGTSEVKVKTFTSR